MSLSTQPYKGARDFYPEQKRVQKYMFSVWRSVCERYGYEEYDAPILESLDIYLAKTGDEIVNEQTYNFTDRGGRQVVIRPEMTPTVSRMVAGRRQELGYPLRWYSIPNLWRYERPQKGRLREHWQLNVDIFGIDGTSAEFEVMQLVNDMFTAFGAQPNMYELRLNHRGLIDYLLGDYLGLQATERHAVGKLIDRFHKLTRSDFIAKLDAVLTPAQRQAGLTEKLLGLLEAKQLTDLPAVAQQQAAAVELQQLLTQLQAAGIGNARFDATLMRGFDYYTGIVFEVFDTNPDNNRSMLGGGRYDGLVGLFGVNPVPTVGFGWGDVTLQQFLEGHGLMPALQPETHVYVALIGDVAAAAQPAIAKLRAAKVNVAVDLSGKKLGTQFKTAQKKQVQHVLIIGETELADNLFTLKNLSTGEESKGTLDGLIQEILST